MSKKFLTLFLFLALLACSNSNRDFSGDASGKDDSIALVNSSTYGNLELKFYDLTLPFNFDIPSIKTFKTNLKLSEVSFFDGEIISEIICPSSSDISLDLDFSSAYNTAILSSDKYIYECLGSDGNDYTVKFKKQSSNNSHAIITAFDFVNNIFYGQVSINRIGDGLGYKELYF
jgi:hypothetical protein